MGYIGIYVIVTGLFLFGIFGVSQNAMADQVELPAEKDNTIFEEGEAKSCGACSTFIVGNNGGDNTRRALIEFDVSSIPPDSTVTAVELSLIHI